MQVNNTNMELYIQEFQGIKHKFRIVLECTNKVQCIYMLVIYVDSEKRKVDTMRYIADSDIDAMQWAFNTMQEIIEFWNERK